MGYTHYWTCEKKGDEKVYQRAIKLCRKVAWTYNQEATGAERLSGYAAHCKPGTYGGLKVNGKQDMAHEDFCLREHWSENAGFNFCKTARKPYDVVVVACLAILKYYMGDSIKVDSDGDLAELQDGIRLAEKITGRKVGKKFKLD
jgi:hypothetical protein